MNRRHDKAGTKGWRLLLFGSDQGDWQQCMFCNGGLEVMQQIPGAGQHLIRHYHSSLPLTLLIRSMMDLRRVAIYRARLDILSDDGPDRIRSPHS